jgi:hypothetical protein
MPTPKALAAVALGVAGVDEVQLALRMRLAVEALAVAPHRSG